jgi:hypothetical protein
MKGIIMKTLMKILIISPLFFLGGCYTHFAERDFDRGRYTYNPDDNNADQEAPQDTTAYNDDQYNNDNYYDDGSHNYRRYLWGYCPSNQFSQGFADDPYYSDSYGWDCLTPGYDYYPWFGYGYYPGFYLGGYFGGLYGYHHFYGSSNFGFSGYRNGFVHRNNFGGRGLRDRSGNYSVRNSTSGRYNTGSNGSTDLSRVRVTRGGGSSGSVNNSTLSGTTRSRIAPPSTLNNRGSSVRNRNNSDLRRSTRMSSNQSRRSGSYNSSRRASGSGSHSSYNRGSSSGRSSGGGASRSSGGGSRSNSGSSGGRTRR